MRLGFDRWVEKISWKRARQPIPIFLPGEPHGQRSLVDYNSWSRKESDTTGETYHTHAREHVVKQTRVFLRYIPRSDISVLQDLDTFSFTLYCQSGLQSDCARLYFS